MKKIQRYIALLVFVSIPYLVVGQQETVKTILPKVINTYQTTPNYHIAMTYEMHRGTGANGAMVKSYSGDFVKQNEFSMLKMLNSEKLNFGKEQVLIDHDSKAIEYQKSTAKQAAIAPVDLSYLLTYYEETSVVRKNGILICSLSRSPKYKIPLPYSTIVLHIDEEKAIMKKQLLVFANKMPFTSKNNEEVYDQGTLVITLKHDFEQKEKVAYALNDYIDISADGMLQPSENYKAYQLIDRTKK